MPKQITSPGMDPGGKYAPFQPIDLPDRRWPDRVIAEPPIARGSRPHPGISGHDL